MCKVNKEAVKTLFKPFPEPDGHMQYDLYKQTILDAINFNNDDQHFKAYVPDELNKVWKKETIVKFLKADEVDKIEFIDEEMDCDDHARILFGRGLPLIWTFNHAMNWFIDPDGVLWYVEPQTDKISATLEGIHMRFMIGV